MSCRCECGWPVHANHQVTVVCPRCKIDIHCTEGPLPPVVHTAQPRDKWPGWAEALARFGKVEDIGVGDTAQRIAARVGGEVFKWLAEKLGLPCGCKERQAEWNKLYPYDQDGDSTNSESGSPSPG